MGPQYGPLASLKAAPSLKVFWATWLGFSYGPFLGPFVVSLESQLSYVLFWLILGLLRSIVAYYFGLEVQGISYGAFFWALF